MESVAAPLRARSLERFLRTSATAPIIQAQAVSMPLGARPDVIWQLHPPEDVPATGTLVEGASDSGAAASTPWETATQLPALQT